MRCNDELFKLISINKIDPKDEIELRVKRELDTCRRINAMHPVAYSGDTQPSTNTYARPENKFECSRNGCVNSGTATLASAEQTLTYRTGDATEFSAGVVTFYVAPGENAPAAVTFKIGDTQAMTNADVYTVNITAAMVGDDGFAPVVIDLSQTPSSVVGNGWTASSGGAFIQLSADKIVGFSSIAIFEALEDFELIDIIKMQCVTSAGDDMSFSTIEDTCQAVAYDSNINTLSFSLTANMVSANYFRANPMYAAGDKTEGFYTRTIKRTVEAYSYGGNNYGKITLADANQDECGRIALQIVNDCEPTILRLLSIPTIVNVGEEQYQVINNADGTTDIIVNAVHVGSELRVSYPQTAEILEATFSNFNLEGKEGSLVWTRHLSDGSTIVDVFDNIFVTTFPRSISNTAATFSWAFSAARDADGNFYREQTILA